jgi:hypothetical protein
VSALQQFAIELRRAPTDAERTGKTLLTQSCITRQIRNNPARTSASDRQTRSLAIISRAIEMPADFASATSSSPVLKGYGQAKSALPSITACAPPSVTKPPPTEK